MTGVQGGEQPGDASLLTRALRTHAFQKEVTEHASQVFENHLSVEFAIATLWERNDTAWNAFQDETPTPEWHGTATDLQPLIRTHVLRLAKGWKNESAVVRYFHSKEPPLISAFGYDGLDDIEQSKLWRAWNKRYSDRLKEAIEEAATIITREARAQGIPAPDKAFRPSQDSSPETSKRTERHLISKHTKEVWQQAKPFVEDAFYLHRGENSRIPEGAWWEQHTYMGTRADMFAESGAESYRDDTTRDRVPAGRHHRDKLQMLDVEETRAMLQHATQALVARARHNSELVGKLTVAIDITKGHPWTGEVERDDDGEIAEPYILGYKGGERHFQWASIQVVGHDIPLVLDVMPVERGKARYEIVDELLETATDLVGGIELVMMDREFDGEAVKNVCQDHDVYYLNPARKHTAERAMCTRLRRAGKIVRIEEQTTFEKGGRKRIYLPSTATDAEPAVEDPDLVNLTDEDSDDLGFRQELLEEFNEIVLDEDDGDLESPDVFFEEVVDELREEQDQRPVVGSEEDAQAYALFETNHPFIESCDTDAERIHMAERMVRRYGHRWGIENGFKKIKKFMVRTSSKHHGYRFFNFAFACVLYNVWRLVDLLVKLAIDGENASYKPKVDANRFLTHAKKYYGIPPPD